MSTTGNRGSPVGDISDWPVNADVSDFCRPPAVSWRYTQCESYLHDYMLPLMDSLVAAEPDDRTKLW
jgi:hypothetical protein